MPHASEDKALAAHAAGKCGDTAAPGGGCPVVCLHVLLPCPMSSMSRGGLMSSCEADVCLELASPGLGRLVSHQWGSKTRESLSEAFVLGTEKAGPAGDSLVEQPEHDTSVPRDSWW